MRWRLGRGLMELHLTRANLITLIINARHNLREDGEEHGDDYR